MIVSNFRSYRLPISSIGGFWKTIVEKSDVDTITFQSI
ncbi:MAG: hypothetical protein OJF61_000255 [Rhodanobacteraceae bacterium]|nr:MAG: hypothetical protein OJF61_000255 [Rhodanobacteraceae bacterium]